MMGIARGEEEVVMILCLVSVGLTALKSDQVHEMMARDYSDKFQVSTICKLASCFFYHNHFYYN